ncbi:UPF0481 protein At3g47200-like [Carya illinoinensis]|uniref:UPF0481 protein At3g47200-like n=1 Tax=Carya illinoinensis TaxID=32201 RepID=UPI001C725523|nr:UPF0481 protein At3g47200-like [Carya illinoinensis]
MSVILPIHGLLKEALPACGGRVIELEETDQPKNIASIDDYEDSVTASIVATISQDLTMPPKPSIFRTPTILSRHNPQAYIPGAFSFGPLHHKNPNISYLERTEKIKERYLKSLISRLHSPETMPRELVRSIASVEREARKCYAGPIDCTPGEFVRILITDGCFIIELFRKHTYTDLRDRDDPIFTMACMLQFLYNDLMLLENQVPWMVLERLFAMTMECDRPQKQLVQLVKDFFSHFLSSKMPPPVVLNDLWIGDIEHILDLLRKWLILSIKEDEYINKSAWQPMPSATSLVEAGIKFKRGKSNMSILSINFNDGVLEIPPLLIQETTETVFRNLIAFEQCYPKCEAKFTSYAVLLDNLISTSKDINILCKNNILDSWLNPEDAVQFFRKLYHNTYVKEYHYLHICQKVNEYCQRRCPRWRAALVSNYFFTPWAGTSTVAAAVLLLLTLVQTVFTVIKK